MNFQSLQVAFHHQVVQSKAKNIHSSTLYFSTSSGETKMSICSPYITHSLAWYNWWNHTFFWYHACFIPLNAAFFLVSAVVLKDPYSGSLVFELLVLGPALAASFCWNLEKQTRKVQGNYSWLHPIVGVWWALSSSGGAGKTSRPITCINTTDMHLTHCLQECSVHQD